MNTNNTKVTDDLTALQGLWKPDSAILSGQALPEVVLEGMSLEITGTNYTVLAAGMTDKGNLKADSAIKQMRILGTEGPNKDKALTAIYKLEGDTLTICYDLTGQNYPNDFSSEANTQNYLVAYKRSN